MDVALIFPECLGAAPSTGVNVPLSIMEPCSIFCLLIIPIYDHDWVCSVFQYRPQKDKPPNQIPWTSEAAEMAVGSM